MNLFRGKNHDTAPMACPACWYPVDAATGITSDEAPEDGSVSICLACGAISVYCNGASALRPPTVEERGELMGDPDIQKAVLGVLNAKDHSPDGWPKGGRLR